MIENSKQESSDTSDRTLEEGIDYYFENGLMVLTEHYLTEQGYCCGNQCRNCPYGYVNVPRQSK
jgi:hypothetical protein